MSSNLPQILHFHDCADVGGALVRAAQKQNINWVYRSAEDVRPSKRPTGFIRSRLFTRNLIKKNSSAIAAADIVHIHYGSAVKDALVAGLGKKPYFLHLHGTDIRKQWVAGGRKNSVIQSYIENAAGVFYTSLDTRANAEEARADAQFMPAFIELERLANWQPATDTQQKIIFLSRWEEIKGLEKQLELVKELRAAFPNVILEGLDWGYGAPDAAKLGVKLVPKMQHSEYVKWIGTASVAVGQAQPMFGVSEFEAMAMGVPIAAVGSRIPRPDNNETPPVIEGSNAEIVDQLKDALADPFGASEELGAKAWALRNHLADPYVPQLQTAYLLAYNN